jgi:Ca-activated chloride channel family protein
MIGWWNNVVFAQPWAFWLLLLIPLLGIFIWLLSGKGRPALQISSIRFFSGVKTPARVRWRPILYVLRLGAIAFLLVSIARPQSTLAWKKTSGNGIDIMMCIDVSPSMEASDFQPTRLEAAKEQAKRFVENRADDRIGIVEFSGEPFTLCPLTTDHKALKNLITTINSGMLIEGTAIGMGLAKSVERLHDSKAKSKVVILLTDGENNAGNISPEDAARLAKTYGIKVYIIGMGAAEGNVLQPNTINPDGSYSMAFQPVNIDEKMLIGMAELTGGKYFRASGNLQLQKIYDDINSMEKSEFDKNQAMQRKEEFLPLLIWAFILLGVELILRYTLFDSIT